MIAQPIQPGIINPVAINGNIAQGNIAQGTQLTGAAGSFDFMAFLSMLFNAEGANQNQNIQLPNAESIDTSAADDKLIQNLLSGIVSDKDMLEQFKAFMEENKGEKISEDGDLNKLFEEGDFSLKDIFNFLCTMQTQVNKTQPVNEKKCEGEVAEVKTEEKSDSKVTKLSDKPVLAKAENGEEIGESEDKDNDVKPVETKKVNDNDNLKSKNEENQSVKVEASETENNNFDNMAQQQKQTPQFKTEERELVQFGNPDQSMDQTVKTNEFANFTDRENRIEGAKVHATVGLKDPGFAMNKQTEDSVFDAVMNGTKILSEKEGGTTQIRLYPDELGMVKIDLRVENNMVKANFFADNAHVKEIIEKNLDQLKDMLSDQNLKLDQANVGLNNHGTKYEQEQHRRETDENYIMSFGYNSARPDMDMIDADAIYQGGRGKRNIRNSGVDILI